MQNIKFNRVRDGVIRGISSLNSKGVHLFITDSQNVRVRRVNISAPGTSPNTDGIHISNSNNVKVARTHIATGDDCIGMIQGSTNIAINNVICGPGHGIRYNLSLYYLYSSAINLYVMLSDHKFRLWIHLKES